MMKHLYVKAPPGYTLEKPMRLGVKIKHVFSLAFITIGAATITTVAYPILSFGFIYSPKFQNAPTIPLVSADSGPSFTPELINTTFDYTNANNWFPADSPKIDLENKFPKTYSLSIPKLGIDGATVIYGATDLKKSLIHYPETAMPGELGNSVIFGHSTLPQFFSPTNYSTIFSTLHTLELGDEILASYDGVEYQYVIASMYEVDPSNLSPLAQRYDRRYLTLITCTPPGTYLRRLIVVAEVA